MFSSQAAIPAALAVHVITIAATLALSTRARWCRRITFGGSAVASALMLVAAADVLGSGGPVAGVLFAHHASGVIVDFAVTPLSATQSQRAALKAFALATTPWTGVTVSSLR